MKVTGTDGKEYTVEPDANLRNVRLRGADLREADLTDANLSGAVWNDETIFPNGFEIPKGSQA